MTLILSRLEDNIHLMTERFEAVTVVLLKIQSVSWLESTDKLFYFPVSSLPLYRVIFYIATVTRHFPARLDNRLSGLRSKDTRIICKWKRRVVGENIV